MGSDREPIRLVLVDDHAVLRSGLKYIIEVIDSIVVVGEASNGLEAVQLAEELNPDVVLMDLMMPEMDGIEATKIISNNHPNIRVIVLSSSKEEEMVQAALASGAAGYLTKSISSAELTRAIERTVTGTPTLSAEATQALIQAKTRPEKPTYNLSEREIEVLKKMVGGLTNPQIAEELYISRATVKRHVSNILAKLEVSSRTEAVALALKYNLIN